jgi:hypothetical protein
MKLATLCYVIDKKTDSTLMIHELKNKMIITRENGMVLEENLKPENLLKNVR